MATNIQQDITKKQIKTGLFYIDSAKFLCDSSLLDSIDIPNNIIEINANTGETLREFKRQSLQIQYNNFTLYIAKYTKNLKGIIYDKFVLMFSAKVSKHYLSGINVNDFKDVLRYLRTLKYINYQDNKENAIIREFFTKDTDIAYNMVVPTKLVPEIVEQWKLIKKFSSNSKDIKVGNKVNNQMIQFGKRGDKYFFKIYNKTLEIRKDLQEFDNLPLSDDERAMFLDYKDTMFRIEITIRNKKDFESLNTSSRLVDLWSLLAKNNKDIAKVVRRYYDEMTGSYVPKTRVYSKLTPNDSMILAHIVNLKESGKTPIEIMDISLSLFDGGSNREWKAKSRAKNKIHKLIDYMYQNDKELIEKQKYNTASYKYIEQMFFMQ